MPGMAVPHSHHREGWRLAPRCRRGALPCSGSTTTLMPCPCMMGSWGTVLSPYLPLLPGLLHHTVRGGPLTLQSKWMESMWHLAFMAVGQVLSPSQLPLAHFVTHPGPSPGPDFWPGSQEASKSWRSPWWLPPATFRIGCSGACRVMSR